MIAGMLAIAMFASSTPTTNAVEQAPAATTAEAAYFPAQFPDMDGEVTPHIEAF